jgi:hypothetical protein
VETTRDILNVLLQSFGARPYYSLSSNPINMVTVFLFRRIQDRVIQPQFAVFVSNTSVEYRANMSRDLLSLSLTLRAWDPAENWPFIWKWRWEHLSDRIFTKSVSVKLREVLNVIIILFLIIISLITYSFSLFFIHFHFPVLSSIRFSSVLSPWSSTSCDLFCALDSLFQFASALPLISNFSSKLFFCFHSVYPAYSLLFF